MQVDPPTFATLSLDIDFNFASFSRALDDIEERERSVKETVASLRATYNQAMHKYIRHDSPAPPISQGDTFVLEWTRGQLVQFESDLAAIQTRKQELANILENVSLALRQRPQTPQLRDGLRIIQDRYESFVGIVRLDPLYAGSRVR
jgi:hypothetical protein